MPAMGRADSASPSVHGSQHGALLLLQWALVDNIRYGFDKLSLSLSWERLSWEKKMVQTQ